MYRKNYIKRKLTERKRTAQRCTERKCTSRQCTSRKCTERTVGSINKECNKMLYNDVSKEKCWDEPRQQCRNVPRGECQAVPQECTDCITVQKCASVKGLIQAKVLVLMKRVNLD